MYRWNPLPQGSPSTTRKSGQNRSMAWAAASSCRRCSLRCSSGTSPRPPPKPLTWSARFPDRRFRTASGVSRTTGSFFLAAASSSAFLLAASSSTAFNCAAASASAFLLAAASASAFFFTAACPFATNPSGPMTGTWWPSGRWTANSFSPSGPSISKIKPDIMLCLFMSDWLIVLCHVSSASSSLTSLENDTRDMVLCMSNSIDILLCAIVSR
mmetsp:Transcript_55420/g.154394  ORF Transcript_55420/g.154394 Transcript_55420/m.154394 type:complete len:213 (-) Transcript_55420:2264-2902(-)